jgi:secondary thiamine-phosphate synthase enzyme
MRQASETITIDTRGPGLVEITRPILRFVEAEAMTTGLLTVFCRHTSASLLIQENADPDVRTDLEAWFATIAPEDPGRYVHDSEGPDDMPAHIRTAVTQVSLSIPLVGGRLVLGTWQGVYLFEHRHRPHRPSIVLHLLGD